MILRVPKGPLFLNVVLLALFFGAPSWGQENSGLDPSQKSDFGTNVIRPEEAERNLVERVAPVYPPLAKQVRIQGKVKLQIMISKTGKVDSVKVLSGHPLFIQAAINAVKQWQYKPFQANGQSVMASTEVEVPFSLGISDADYQIEQKNNQAYFKREGECRNLLKMQKYPEAEASCRSAVELSEKLPPGNQNERRLANQLTGDALFREKNYPEALSFFKAELAIGEASLKPTDAELGYAYHHVALAFHATDDLQKAQSFYEKSEATLRVAREHIDGEFFKNEYAKAIRSVLRDYIVLLQQTGQDEAAAKAQQRAEVITGEIHPVK